MPKSTVRKKTPRPSPERGARKRRGIGRPASGQQAVGREALIARTCEMLRQMPPNKVTRAEVARYMNVDPSLIRYYFRDRSTLLVAAVEKITADFLQNLDKELSETDMTPSARLRARVATQLKLNITHPFFHRLLIDELVHIDSPVSGRFLDTLTHRAVNAYGGIIEDGVKDGSLRRMNTAFLFVALMGMCEFFVNGMPILRRAMGKDFDERVIGDRYREFVCDLLINGMKNAAPGGSRSA